MSKLGTVINFEVVRTLKKPTFWLSVLAIPLLLGVIFGIVYFSNSTTAAIQEQEQKEPFAFAVLDQSGIVSDEVIDQFNASRIENKAEGIQKVKADTIEAYFVYPKDLSKGNIEIYHQHTGLMSDMKFDAIAKAVLTSSASAQVGSVNTLVALQGSVKSTQTAYRDGQNYDPIGSIVAPLAFLVLFYAVIVLLGNQMLASTTEEKENRVTEMILTSITSRTLIIGKIISLGILGIIQIATITIPVILVYIFARDALSIPDVSEFIGRISIDMWQILLGASVFISGLTLFTGLLVGIGAAMPTAKEANSFFGVVILMMFVPFYFFSLLMSDSESIVIDGLSYFPLTAPVTLMIRNAFGTITTVEAAIGTAIVLVSGFVALALAIRIFRYGTLEYSNRISLRNIFKPAK